MMMDQSRSSRSARPVQQGILIAGKDGHILSADETVCGLLHYRADDLYGQSLWALIGYHPEPPCDETLKHRSQAVVLPRPGLPAFVVTLSTLSLAQQELFVCTIRLQEEQAEDRVGFLASAVDALQQAKAEMQLSLDKEKEVNQLKTRFVSLASHEFRTPLSSIQLSAALVERYYDRLDRDQVFRHLHKIRLAVGALTEILEDFLCLEKMNSGSIAPVYEQVDLPLFCRGLVSEMKLQAKPGQEMVYDHEGEQTCLVTDKKLLRHCLLNLLSNAIKYSPENLPVRLTTRFSGPHCEIDIADQGLGIPLADQAGLFEPFFRAHNVMDIQGTGLGLSIVRRYTELMNGSIRFQSEEHRGTLFTLSFPVR
ncbi:PAS domain-containing sensor histidine kinase [Mucilaginibacter sp. CAU 1740]|uniref:sensor histidine kinase n=1 Tax=Mucilaginibacter sp. CAU 1740 TaxID=3140365 RepID=UPI00325B3341